MMGTTLAIAIFVLGFASGALVAYAWLSDQLSIADYEPTEHGESPL